MIDRDLINKFLKEVDENLKQYLYCEKGFENFSRLLKRYEEIKEAIRVASDFELKNSVACLGDIVNEMCVAIEILSSKETCINLVYEYKVQNDSKTIDFCAKQKHNNKEITVFYDVKSIHPKSTNRWDQFCKIKENALITENNNVILDEDWLGGEIWHGMYEARQKFLQYTLEFEGKILILNDKTAHFYMVFCSNGINWMESHLEDFADFYITGCYNPDDPFSKMEQHDISEKSILLRRNITGFHYLERGFTEIKPTRVYGNVHGPWRMWLKKDVCND